MVTNLGEIELSVLTAIVAGLRAWTRSSALERFGREHLEALEAAGWIVCWSAESSGRRLRSPSYTLTAWAAEQLGVELIETETKDGPGIPFWLSIHADDEERAVELGRRGHVGLATPSLIPERPKAPRDPTVLCDREGEPITIQGRFIALDARLARRKKKARSRRGGSPRRSG